MMGRAQRQRDENLKDDLFCFTTIINYKGHVVMVITR